MIENRAKKDSTEVQELVRKHYHMLKRFWTPTKESYPSHGRLIVETELRKAYEVFHPQMPEFLAEAMQIFADREL